MSYIDETAETVTTPSERHALLAQEFQRELDAIILERITQAMKAVNESITRRGDKKRGPERKYAGETPDEILRNHGITFEKRPRLYLAYDRAARVLAGIAVCGRGPYAKRNL